MVSPLQQQLGGLLYRQLIAHATSTPFISAFYQGYQRVKISPTEYTSPIIIPDFLWTVIYHFA